MKSTKRDSQVRQSSAPLWWGILLLFVGLLVLASLATPANAAPPNQTVPDPTATPELVVPTATPVRNNGNGDNDTSGDTSGDDGLAPIDEENDPLTDALPVGGAVGGVDPLTGLGDDAAAELVPIFMATIKTNNTSVYAGPGTAFPVIGTVDKDQEFAVIGRNTGLTWYVLCCPAEGEQLGWVSARSLKRAFDLVSAVELPVVTDLADLDMATIKATMDAAAEANAEKAPALTLTVVQSPQFVRQGGTVLLRFTATNQGPSAVDDVTFRFELPAQLLHLDSASKTGEVEVTEEQGATVVAVQWPTLAPATSGDADIELKIAQDVDFGAVIEGLAVLNAPAEESVTTGIFVGMPPSLTPDFR